MLLPLKHEGMSLRRFPWVTALIVLVCSVIWGITLHREKAISRESDALLARACEIAAKRPALAAESELESRMRYDGNCRYSLAHPEEVSAPLGLHPEREFAELEEEILRLEGTDVRSRLAFGQGKQSLSRLFGSMFAHGSWSHIVFNMWFLILSGLAIEDRLGRPFFVALYLLSGIAGGLAHRALSEHPAIGASGAIAGLMGAFMLLFPFEKIRVGIVSFVPFRGGAYGRFGYGIQIFPMPPISLAAFYFPVPALFLSGLWFVGEVMSGASGEATGVAHFAHLGGFVLGALVAVFVNVSGADRALTSAVRKKAYNEADYAAASKLATSGDPKEAAAHLAELLEAEGVDRIAIQRLRLGVARRLRSRTLEAQIFADMLKFEIGRRGAVLETYREVMVQGLDAAIPLPLRLRVLETLADLVDADVLEMTLASMMAGDAGGRNEATLRFWGAKRALLRDDRERAALHLEGARALLSHCPERGGELERMAKVIAAA